MLRPLRCPLLGTSRATCLAPAMARALRAQPPHVVNVTAVEYALRAPGAAPKLHAQTGMFRTFVVR